MALNWASLIQAHIQGKEFSFAPPGYAAWLPGLADSGLAYCLLLAVQVLRKRDG